MIKYLIRNEFWGPLLFSIKLKKYIVPNTKESIYFLSQLIRGKRKNEILLLIKNDLRVHGVIFKRLINEINKLDLNENTIKYINNKINKIKDYLSAPLNIYLDYTSKCNLNCKHCYILNNPKETRQELTNAELRDIISQIYKIGCFRIDIAGGEPLLFPNKLFTCISEAKKFNIGVSITTNGTIMNEYISNKLMSENIKTITVSLSGVEQNSHEYWRGGGTFKKLIKTVKTLRQSKEKLHSETNLSLKLTFFPNLTENEFVKVINLAKKLKVDKLKMNPMRPAGKIFSNKLWLNIEGYYSILDLIGKYSKTEGPPVIIGPLNPYLCEYSDLIKYIKTPGCIAGKELIWINSFGDVELCPLLRNSKIGNVREQSLKLILLNSHLFKKIRSIEINSECAKCSSFLFCRGGCKCRIDAFGGNILEDRDPLCPVDANKIRITKKHKNFKDHFQEIGLPHSL